MPRVLRNGGIQTMIGHRVRMVAISRISHLVPPHLIDRIPEELDHVEPIENDLGVRQSVANSFLEGRAHVDAHQTDSRAALGAEQIEQPVENLCTFTLRRPDHLPGLVVRDHGHELLRPPPADLVDADPGQILERVRVAFFGNHSSGDPSGREPADLEVRRDRGLIGSLQKPGKLVFERAGEHRTRPCPRNRGRSHPAAAATHPRQIRPQHHPASPEAEMTPFAMLHHRSVKLGSNPSAPSAPRTSPRWTHVEIETPSFEPNPANRYVCHVEQLPEQCRQAHRACPPRVLVSSTTDYGKWAARFADSNLLSLLRSSPLHEQRLSGLLQILPRRRGKLWERRKTRRPGGGVFRGFHNFAFRTLRRIFLSWETSLRVT